MAGPAGGRDQTSNDPTGNFAASAASQFGPSYYPIDTELTNMSANYNLASYGRPMEEASSAVEKMDPNMNNMAIDTNGGATSSVVDPAMAPPQTPGQAAFPATASRASLDASSETPQDPQTGDKRKRSKASRACDECRRKKVKCDAPTEVDGTPKTCSNCQKANVNCEFERKPMKRGPSKGYISALAERVQGLEQKQRQSFDAAQSAFSESFSPDEQSGPGFNRTSSFSGPAPFGPFPRSEYSREKIPSTGWNSGFITRPRGSGSLAVAPNDTSASSTRDDDNTTTTKLHVQLTPTSLPSSFPDPRPSKRARTQGPDTEMDELAIDQAFLDKYVQQYHPLLPVLPEPAKVVQIFANATSFAQHAFVTAIEVLPDLRIEPVVNGTHVSDLDPAIGSVKKPFTSTHFRRFETLAQYLLTEDEMIKSTRTQADMITLVWAVTLLAVACENDAMRLLKSQTSRFSLLSIGRGLMEEIRDTPANTGEPHPYSEEAESAYNCLVLLLQYEGLGAAKPLDKVMKEPYTMMIENAKPANTSLEAAFLATSSVYLHHLVQAILSAEPHPSSHVTAMRSEFRRLNVAFARTGFDANKSVYCSFLGRTTDVKRVDTFFGLCMAPYVGPTLDLFGYASKVLEDAIDLAKILIQDAQDSIKAPRYQPLDLYMWCLTAVTLCEYRVNCTSERIVDIATTQLDLLVAELKKKSELFHKNYGYLDFWGGGGDVKHWTDSLLAMIDWVKDQPLTLITEPPSDGVLFLPNLAPNLQRGFMITALWFTEED